MPRLRLLAAIAIPLVGASPRAFALNQSVHYQISYDTCRREGGPEGFCQQVGVAAHNVDDYEFNDLAAHSQMEDGQTACDGANQAIWRVFWFGTRIRPLAQQAAIIPTHASISGLAVAVGRALHTLQDNCAHSGMPNPQHAWKSISDFCEGTNTSPDLAPEALQCGKEETAAVLDAVFDVLADNGAIKADLDDVDEKHNHMTDLADGCHFLGGAATWNGEDRRWDNTIVRPYMRREIVDAILHDDARHGWVCDSAPDGLLISYDNDVDVSDGPDSCLLIHLACVGKADGEVTTDGPSVPPAPDHGGCDVSGSSGGGFGAALVALAMAFAARARRSRA